MTTNPQPYDTYDMGLAIALLCDGFQLIDLERPTIGNRINFRFEPARGLNEAAQAFWNGRLMVNAKSYWNESKNLKARLYSVR